MLLCSSITYQRPFRLRAVTATSRAGWQEGSITPARWLAASSHSSPVLSETDELFKQFFMKREVKTLFPAMGYISRVYNPIQPAYSFFFFFRNIKEPEVENLSHLITKKPSKQHYPSCLLCAMLNH